MHLYHLVPVSADHLLTICPLTKQPSMPHFATPNFIPVSWLQMWTVWNKDVTCFFYFSTGGDSGWRQQTGNNYKDKGDNKEHACEQIPLEDASLDWNSTQLSWTWPHICFPLLHTLAVKIPYPWFNSHQPHTLQYPSMRNHIISLASVLDQITGRFVLRRWQSTKAALSIINWPLVPFEAVEGPYYWMLVCPLIVMCCRSRQRSTCTKYMYAALCLENFKTSWNWRTLVHQGLCGPSGCWYSRMQPSRFMRQFQCYPSAC